MDPSSFAVLPSTFAFRKDAFSEPFNPTNTKPPFFQVFHKDFLKIIGPNARIHQIARNDTFAFAHEAPIYHPGTDEVFFSSNNGGPLGHSDWDNNNLLGKISMQDVDTALAQAGVGEAVNVKVTMVGSSSLNEMLESVTPHSV